MNLSATNNYVYNYNQQPINSSLSNRSATCIFNNLGVQCSKNMDFGCFCTNHMSAIFHMVVANDVVATRWSTRRLTKQMLTEPTDIVFPFPFEIEQKDGKFNICVNTTMANTMVGQYAESMRIRDNANQSVRTSLAYILISLICNGSISFESSMASSLFQQYTMSYMKLYKERFSNMQIQILNFPTKGKSNFIQFSNLPFLYMVLFQFCEFSTVRKFENENVVTFAANIALDYNRRAFVTINETVDTPQYYLKDSTTTGSPLIIAGIRHTNVGLDAFSTSQVMTNPLSILPTLCNQQNTIMLSETPMLPSNNMGCSKPSMEVAPIGESNA